MSHVYHELVFHFVWATKNREPLITPKVESHLFPFIERKCKQLGYWLHAVNGTKDHLHVLITLSPTDLIANVAKNLKGASSHYINKELGLEDILYWQEGYGVLSLRKKDIAIVADYIRRQKEHHQAGTLITKLERWEAARKPAVR